MQQDVWSGNLSIKRLKEFVKSEAERLSYVQQTKRVARQLQDAKRFLDLLNYYPYMQAKTVSQLKKLLIKRRNELKEMREEITHFLPGYQLNFFDKKVDLSSIDQAKLINQRNMLDNKIKWLHKCLGICHNKMYFK